MTEEQQPLPDETPDPDRTGAYQPAGETGPTAGLIAERYRLLEPLGEGGMGSVYRAEQLHPVRREVAIKLIKPGMDSQRVVARFEAERQALAVMDHPAIAKVLDAGTTPDGRPFFVMELVHGIPLTQYCDTKRLSIAERLALFVQICQAVQHAHQKGVIHRDLKPSNILVGESDSHPLPKIIDFGLAKALVPDVLPETSIDGVGSVLGTPLYMAPEQADPATTDIDTRADVYALGAILYELLTGSTPITRESLHGVAFAAMMQAIREVEPPTPIRRLEESHQSGDIAAARQLDLKRLKSIVAQDLGWVTMRCLEKDRRRRYETANALALDVQRFLSNEPVLAVPPSFGYRSRKFIRRNRVAVLASSLVALALVGGIVGTTIGLRMALVQRNQAIEAREDQGRALEAEQRERAAAVVARGEAVEAKTNAERSFERERDLRKLSDRTLYRNRIAFARRELDEFNAYRALEYLKLCPEEYRQWEWRYLWERSQIEERVVKVSNRPAHHLIMSPDRQTLAVGIGAPNNLTERASIHIFNATTLERKHLLRGEVGGFPEINFHPTTGVITALNLSVDTSQTLQKVPLQSAISCSAYTFDQGDLVDIRRGISLIKVNHDGRLEATARLRDMKLVLRDVPNDKVLFTSDVHPGPLVAATFSKDDRWLVSLWQQTANRSGATFNMGARLWDLQKRQLHLEIANVTAVCLTPDSKQLLVAVGSDLQLWDIESKKQLATLRGHRGQISTIDLQERDDGLFALTCASDRTVRLWDIHEQRLLNTFVGHEAGVNSVQFGANGRIFSAGSDGSIRIFRPEAADAQQKLATFNTVGSGLVFLDEDHLLVSSSLEPTIINITTKQRSILPHRRGEFVSYAAKAKRIAVADRTQIDFYDVADVAQKGLQPVGKPIVVAEGMVTALALDPDAKRLFLSTYLADDGCLEARDLTTGEVLWTQRVKTTLKRVLALAVHPDGHSLAISQLNDESSVLDAATGNTQTPIAPPIGESGLIVAQRGVAFHPSGQFVVSGAGNGANPSDRPSVFLTDLRDAKTRALKGHDAMISGVVFSPDGDRLATASIDHNRGQAGEVKLWDVESGEEMLTLPGAMAVAFSPSGQRLVSCHFDALMKPEIVLWTATKKAPPLAKLPPVVRGNPEQPPTLTFVVNPPTTITVNGQPVQGAEQERPYTPPKNTDNEYRLVIRALHDAPDGGQQLRIRTLTVLGGEQRRVDLTRRDPDETDTVIDRAPPIPTAVARAMIELAGVKKEDVVFDIGCDGPVLLDPILREIGVPLKNVHAYSMQNGATELLQQHLKATPSTADVKLNFAAKNEIRGLEHATVIFLRVPEATNEHLRAVMEKTLKPGVRVVSYRDFVPEWFTDASKIVVVNQQAYPLLLWRWRSPGQDRPGVPATASLREWFDHNQWQQWFGLRLNNQGTWAKTSWLKDEWRLDWLDGRDVAVNRSQQTMQSAAGDQFKLVTTTVRVVYALEGDGPILRGEWVRTSDDQTIRRQLERTAKGYRLTTTISGIPPQVTVRELATLRTNLREERELDAWIAAPRQVGDTKKHALLNWDGETFEGIAEYRWRPPVQVIEAGVPRLRQQFEIKDGEHTLHVELDRTKVKSICLGDLARTDAEPMFVAQRLGKAIDLTQATAMFIDRELGPPEQLAQLQLRITGLKEHRPVVSEHLTWKLDPTTQDVLIDAKPDAPPKEAKPLSPADKALYLKATPTVEADHPALIQKAKEIVGTVQKPHDQGTKINQWLYANMKKIDLERSESALSILGHLSGDCTEHARLFVGLARAAGLPAREVGGLMYWHGQRQPQFAWHAWAEFHNGREWVSVDPAWNQVWVDATHIKFGIEGENNYLVNRLKLAVVGVQKK